MDCCHSRIWRSHVSFSCSLVSMCLPSEATLYFQWAAIPYSASRCISNVRIWISKGWPVLPIRVVWSDW